MKKLLLLAFLISYVTALSAQSKYLGNYTEQFDGSEWKAYDSVKVSYNADKLPTVELTYFYAPPWFENQKVAKTYNSAKQLTSEIIQVAIAGKLTNHRKRLYIYSSTGIIEKSIVQEWENGTWHDAAFIDYNYDSKGLLIQENTKIPDQGALGNKIDYSQHKITYHSAGYRTQELFLTPDGHGGWKDSARITYSANVVKDTVGILELYISNAWAGMEKVTNTYHTEGRKISSRQEIAFGGDWYDNLRTQYYYEQPSAIVENKLEREVNIFPNPARNLVHVRTASGRIEKIAVCDLAGKPLNMDFAAGTGYTSIDVSTLPQGEYVLMITFDGGNVGCKKLIVR
jgi:hypothetical protein